MKKVMAFTYEADPGQSLHNFAKELCMAYDRCGIDVVGLYNGIVLNVNKYENPMSINWQYMYKNLIEKTI